MANVNGQYAGASPCVPIRNITYYVKGTNAKIFAGDFVMMGSDGKVVVATAGSTALIGVAAGYQSAASTTVAVYDDPDQQYYLQDDGVGGTLAQTSVGLNADIVATAGNVTFAKSQHKFDTNGIQTTTANLRLIGYHPDDTVGKYVRTRVVINEHAWAKTTTGA